MKKIIYVSTFILTGVFLINSCAPNKMSKDGNPETTVSIGKNLIGKRFTEQTKTPVDPRLGGASFIDFKSDKEASIKFGDIVQQWSYEITGKTIVFKKMNQNSQVFKISIVDDKTLKGEGGNIWK